jgi:hypothetical protein
MIRMEIIGDIGAMMAAEIKAGERAVTKAVGDAGTSLKTAWRARSPVQRSGRSLRAPSAPNSFRRARTA